MSQSDKFSKMPCQKIIANKNKAIPPVKVGSLTEFYSMFLFSVWRMQKKYFLKVLLEKQIQAARVEKLIK